MQYKFRSLHGSQKPLKLIDRIIRASTERGDVVWEPFGGLCPGAVVSRHLGRKYHAAEPIPEFYAAAVERLHESRRAGNNPESTDAANGSFVCSSCHGDRRTANII